jgi:hypothetical protein
MLRATAWTWTAHVPLRASDDGGSIELDVDGKRLMSTIALCRYACTPPVPPSRIPEIDALRCHITILSYLMSNVNMYYFRVHSTRATGRDSYVWESAGRAAVRPRMGWSRAAWRCTVRVVALSPRRCMRGAHNGRHTRHQGEAPTQSGPWSARTKRQNTIANSTCIHTLGKRGGGREGTKHGTQVRDKAHKRDEDQAALSCRLRGSFIVFSH